MLHEGEKNAKRKQNNSKPNIFYAEDFVCRTVKTENDLEHLKIGLIKID